MLWNRVRYIWPFAPAWFVGLACAAVLLGLLLGRIHRAFRLASPALLGVAVALLGVRLPWALYDLSLSARAIALQQVELGRWARGLPADALIGVNDTGAIAYMSGRRTFDVVGLTTEGEARYWVAGAGSRYEHYERLGEAALPTHFIVYPQWMACPAVLGHKLTEATVRHQTILGGPTMVAYKARYELLGSGSKPFSRGPWGRLLDELDVADLESEAAHGYWLGPASPHDNNAVMWPAPEGHMVADGGRRRRGVDQFWVTLPPRSAAVMVMRVASALPLEVWIDERPVGVVRTAPDGPDAAGWVERWLSVPPSAAARRFVTVRPSAPGDFASFHYWWFAAAR